MVGITPSLSHLQNPKHLVSTYRVLPARDRQCVCWFDESLKALHISIYIACMHSPQPVQLTGTHGQEKARILRAQKFASVADNASNEQRKYHSIVNYMEGVSKGIISVAIYGLPIVRSMHGLFPNPNMLL